MEGARAIVKLEPVDEEPMRDSSICSEIGSFRSESYRPSLEDSADDYDCLIGRKRRVFTDGDFTKKPKCESSAEEVGGFGDSLPSENKELSIVPAEPEAVASFPCNAASMCKQFWKAGDYEGFAPSDCLPSSHGMDHVRVHPKFLHSNATSHKWALGAIAELLDNSLDEVCNGATFVSIDVIQNKKDRNKMLLVEDNGGGMDPDRMRQCMSLGYSAKSKLANTIGQYGNGFKTSTMRLGADVIVFTRSRAKNGTSATQSIGLLSYTFLRNTGKEDIVVPIIDYEKVGGQWGSLIRHSSQEWSMNLDTILMWSPYANEEELFQQFEVMDEQGTRVVIYNLWEDDEGSLELDFHSDDKDIQLRGVNRDPQKIAMAETYPNSRHFLAYRHSLRSYASILYLRLPMNFRIFLRGRVIDHHHIVTDMMHTTEVTYKPQSIADGSTNDHMVAVVSLGFVKDATAHIDIQGFNVYHKNRLIMPFWRVWNAAGSSGRGVIGVLEANFIEPAHDKQGFERTTVLSRLEARLIAMQKTYWTKNCDKIGYASSQRPKKPVPVSVAPPAALWPHPSPPPVRSPQPQSSPCPDLTPEDEPHQLNKPFLHSVPVMSRCVNLDVKKDAGVTLKESGGGLKPRAAIDEANRAVDLLFERETYPSLVAKLRDAKRRMGEQEVLIRSMMEEKKQRDDEERTLKARLQGAMNVIYGLVAKLKDLESQHDQQLPVIVKAEM